MGSTDDCGSSSAIALWRDVTTGAAREPSGSRDRTPPPLTIPPSRTAPFDGGVSGKYHASVGRPHGLTENTPNRASEPADATLNVADWQGAAPPPLDPKGFRAGVGAEEGGGRLWGGGRRSGDQPSRRTRRPRSWRASARGLGGRGGGAPRQPCRGHAKRGPKGWAGLATLSVAQASPGTPRARPLEPSSSFAFVAFRRHLQSE